jgi:hypothetical protein
MAFGTNVCFTSGAGKTIAARAVEQFFIPGFSTMGAGNFNILFIHQ